MIENRPGAATAIAAERVARAAPDGYTLLLIAISTAVQSALRTNLPYDLERDLAPVSQLAIGPFVLVVHPSLPVRSVGELVALARARPGQLDYGSPGIGSANHLAAEFFSLQAGVRMAHVPFKGSGEAVVAAAAGQVPVSFPSLAGARPLLETGRLRPLAVSTARRVASLGAVPTLAESGLTGYDYAAWYGMSAPAAVPREIVARLNAALGAIVQLADVREALGRQGMEPRAGTAEAFAALIRREIDRTAKLIRVTGLKAE